MVTEHKKHVTVSAAIALYVSSVLGGGILVLPGLTAVTAGTGALIAWISVSVICLPIASMFGRLSSVLPDAGGVSSFVRKAFGDTLGDLTGWLYFWVIPFGQPAVMLSGLAYAQYAFRLPRAATYVLAWVILCSSCMLNIVGTRISARAQSAISGAIIVLLFATILVSVPKIHIEAYQPLLPHGWSFVGADTSPLWQSLLKVGNVRLFFNSAFRPGGLAIDRNFNLVSGRGKVAENAWARGIPVEGSKFYTFVVPRAGVNSTALVDAGRAVGKMLSMIAERAGVLGAAQLNEEPMCTEAY